MAEEQDEFTPPKISTAKRYRYLFQFYFFSIFAKVTIFILLDLIPALFAPFALVFELLVVLPVSKFTFKMNKSPAFCEMDENKLPTKVWQYFEDSRTEFINEGFVKGRVIGNLDMFPDQKHYAMLMVNRDAGIGVGFIYIDMLNVKDESLDVQSCEFTCIKDNIFYDLTNTTQVEPFLPMPERKRLILEEYPNINLLYIFRQMQEKMQCRSNDKMLELLETNPRVIMNDEARMMQQSIINRGYMYSDDVNNVFRITWKGALFAIFQVMWPGKSWYRKKLEKQAKAFLKEIGIDADEVAWPSDEGYFKLENKLTSVDEVITFSTSYANKAGFSGSPVNITFNYSFENSKTTINSVDIRYEFSKDYPDREMCRKTIFSLYMDNIEMEGYEMEREDNMMSYQEYEEYEMDRSSKQGLPEPLEIMQDFDLLFSKYYEMLEREMGEGTLSLEMRDNIPVWKIRDYSEDKLCITLNAENAEFISKAIEPIEY